MDVQLACIEVNGVVLHVAEAGPKHGRLVILLHGCPEYWEAWERYFEPLAAAGYHVVAPDQRGYNLSDKPSEVAAYDLDKLALDVLGLADHFIAQADRHVASRTCRAAISSRENRPYARAFLTRRTGSLGPRNEPARAVGKHVNISITFHLSAAFQMER